MDMLNSVEEDKLNGIINYITDSFEYKKCIKLKKLMSAGNIKEKVNEVKKLQKLYIKENDKEIKKMLDKKLFELNKIPIYVEYNYYLQKVNEMINLVKDELNEYFYKVLNEGIDL